MSEATATPVTHVLGIDPGATGAIVVLHAGSGRIDACFDTPTVEIRRGRRTAREVDAHSLASTLEAALMACGPVHAYVERVHAMPKQGVSSMFAFGRALGVLEGVLAALHVPFEFINPLDWRRIAGVAPGKDGSRLTASRLWPADAQLFARVKDDGRAEAALIARAGLLSRQRGARG